jgi:RimJ/RimL family protein N-acetyltransferase
VEDAEALSEAVTDSVEHLRPWMPWIAAEPLPMPERRAMVRRWSGQTSADEDHLFGIFLGGVVVGACGLHNRIGPGVREIGYWVRQGYTRRGVARAAAGLLTTRALAMTGIERVEIRHDKANVASAGVPRSLGYSFTGEWADGIEAPGEMGISCHWQMTAPAWESRRAP